MSHPMRPRRGLALATALATGAAGLAVIAVSGPVAPASAVDTVTVTDDFEGVALDDRYDVVNPNAANLSVSGGKLRITGEAGDTYQDNNSAKNIVMLDVPAGDFTATVDVTAPVSKVYQGAGLIAWQDIDNYVRSGLTFVGGLSPAGTVVETDVETNARFAAQPFAPRQGSTAERLRMQRVGNAITTSYYNPATDAWVTAASATVAFDTTQVGLYALGAQDGTTVAATFDDFTLEHAQGADVTPSGTFVLEAEGDAPYLVRDEGTTPATGPEALRLTDEQPTTSLRLTPTDLGGGAVGLTTEDDRPVVLGPQGLVVETTGNPTPMRLTDLGGGLLGLRVEGGDNATGWVVPGPDGTLVAGAQEDAVGFTLSEVSDAVSTMSVDGDGSGAQINDSMFGIFYEDINWGADGGLYAELVRNRSFEFNNTDNGSYNGLTGWQVVNRAGAGSTATVVNDAGRLNDLNRFYLDLQARAAGDGVRNAGFDGVAVQQGKVYDAYVWARTTTAQDLAVQIEDAAGTGVLASGVAAVDGSNEWKKYPVTLTATGTTTDGRVAVLAGTASRIALDMVSVMPRDTWVGPVNGRSVLRKDLMEKVAAMNPGFLRFPGGCVTNAGTFDSYAGSNFTDRQRTYQWKETIGPVEERPTNKNFWGYNQTYGIGYLEYLEMAEDLGAEPLPVVSVGANGCGSNLRELTNDRPELLQRWIDDTVDLIEFANGPVTSEWGAVRAELGHPEPFGLTMIGLGNEENTHTFEANFPRFRDAVQAAYPDIQIISNSGPDDTGTRFDELWEFNREQDVDLVDEHYYNEPSWFTANHNRYDSYDRDGPKVFLGEYASQGNNWRNALVEASYMTGLQRNADVVRLASYAPLLANENHIQWTPANAIYFDNDESWARPNWEVQKLFGNNVGDEVVPSTFDGEVNQPQDIDGGVFLSTWATSAAYDNVEVTDNETGDVLFEDGFTDASLWQRQNGTWAVNNGRYLQSSTSVTDARSIVAGAYDKPWSNYTLELDATKLAGAEGFLVGFAAGGPDDYYWWNVGGFNNTRSVLQRANGGGAAEVEAVEGRSVTTDQTYRLKVVVDGTTISLYQDDELQMTYDQADASQQLFQVVTRDTRTGDLVAKVVNTAGTPVRTDVSVEDADVEPMGTVTTLAAPLDATNTKANPTRIAPRTRAVALDDDFTYEFPANSVTFIRMPTRDGLAPTALVRATGRQVNGWYDSPATVRVSATDDRAVDHLEVRVDDGAWRRIAGDAGTVRVVRDGRHTVAVRAYDRSGNLTEIRPLAIAVDNAAPVSRAALARRNGRRVVVLAGQDSGSGLARLEYRIGSGDWRRYRGPVVVGARAVVVRHRGVDRLGHVEKPGHIRVSRKARR